MLNINVDAVKQIIRLAKAANTANSQDNREDVLTNVITTIDGSGSSIFSAQDIALREFMAALSDEDQLSIAALMYVGRDSDSSFDVASFEHHLDVLRDHYKSGSSAMLSKSLKLAEYLERGLALYQKYVKSAKKS